ncbi:MAG: ABC transporter ATP-binding protein [Candidatus Aminicenantes bacterium]|nr:ABC transporter ATP-binding protein [Candidatus Aminicenantes bacterium]
MCLLEVTDLTVTREGNPSPLLKNVDIKILTDRVTVLLGESGSGKTILCRTLAGLLPDQMMILSGDFFFTGKPVSYRWIQKKRGRTIFYTPQNATASLNPVLKIKNQLNEVFHKGSMRLSDIFIKLGLPDYHRILNSYPFELSGGENQRCLLAMAIALAPRLLILDEPVTSLDVFLQKEFMTLVKKITVQHPMTILMVTHNLEMVENWADIIYIMYKGKIVESGDFPAVLLHPEHHYTRELIGYF